MQKVVRTYSIGTDWDKELTPLLEDGWVVVMSNPIENKIEYILEKKEIKKKKAEDVRHKYGKDGHVMLTDSQYETLKKEFPYTYEEWIRKVDEYVQETGKTYKDYLTTIRKWARKDSNKGRKNITQMVTGDDF